MTIKNVRGHKQNPAQYKFWTNASGHLCYENGKKFLEEMDQAKIGSKTVRQFYSQDKGLIPQQRMLLKLMNCLEIFVVS